MKLDLKETIRNELKQAIKEDHEIKEIIITVVKNETEEKFADRRKTDDKFEKILSEIHKINERLEKHDKRLEEQGKRLEEQGKELKKQGEMLSELYKEFKAYKPQFDASITAIGARWGIKSEASFRNALKGILENNFDVQVIRYQDLDEEGEVFGYPEQVEIDLIIHNHKIIIAEIKSSMSKGDMYIFNRKAKFYEKKNKKKANKLIVISPMIDNKAKEAARKLKIEFYSSTEEINKL